MLQSASSLPETAFLRTMVLGFAKVGKTTSIISSAVRAFGRGVVLCCSTKEHMASAKAECPDGWDWALIKSVDDMDGALKEVRKGVKEGLYKWVLVDDFNLYADEVEEAMKKMHQGGFKTYPAYRSHLRNTILRLSDLEVHLFTSMHYIEVSEGEIEGQSPKKGNGIVPLLTGVAKATIPGIFNQVIFMEKTRQDKRVFYVNPAGVWGAGCNNVRGTHEIDADVGKLFELVTAKQETSK